MKKPKNPTSSYLVVGTEVAKKLKPIISPMTNKELKRACYIYTKEQAGVILSESEQSYLDEHREEYLASDYHKKHDLLSDEDEQALKKYLRIPDGVDTREFLMNTKKNVLRKKFANKLKSEEDGK
jgi:hypothetical protein